MRPASPFAVAVDMAAGMAEELERGGGGGVRSEVEGVERPSWRTGGDRRSQVDGCEALLRGPSGGESTRRRAPDETRARLERGRGDECEISRERSREPSHGVVAVGGGDSGGGVAVVLRWPVCLVDDDGRSSLRVRSATGFGSLL